MGVDVAYVAPDVVAASPKDFPYLDGIPVLVVEVLSPSTSSIDLREKLLVYKRIESLRAYIIVFQDQRRVLRHYRAEGNNWFVSPYERLRQANERQRARADWVPLHYQ